MGFQNNKFMLKPVYFNTNGDIFCDESGEAIGRTGRKIKNIDKKYTVPISEHMPLHWINGGFIPLKKTKEQKYPGACIVPSGYLRNYYPAYKKLTGKPYLPFFAYTAICWDEDVLMAAASRLENVIHWDPSQYNGIDLPKRIKKMQKNYPSNRLLDHLAGCALNYGCFTAQNIFYERWEGGIPVSPACNSGCLGCLSAGEKFNIKTPQQRLLFTPTQNEVIELALNHLKYNGNMVSFGQGCEGEPTMQAELLEGAISGIREKCQQGLINCNTNGANTKSLKRLFNAGLQSVRITINSTNEKKYSAYYRPKDYSFKNVIESIELASDMGIFINLNILVLPGENDTPSEIEGICRILKNFKIGKLLFRNLNIDFDLYYSLMPEDIKEEKPIGVNKMTEEISGRFPLIPIGSFNNLG